jgi:hypothetical protein
MTENYDFNEIEKFAQEFEIVRKNIFTELSLKRDELVKGLEEIVEKVFSDKYFCLDSSFEEISGNFDATSWDNVRNSDRRAYTNAEEDPEDLKKIFQKEKEESPTWKGQQTENFKKWKNKRKDDWEERCERVKEYHKADREDRKGVYSDIPRLYRECLDLIKSYEKDIEDFKPFFKNSMNKMIVMIKNAPKCPCVSVKFLESNDNTPRITYVRKKRKFLFF